MLLKGKPTSSPIGELANLLTYSQEEILGEEIDFCKLENRKFIAEFLCKDISAFHSQEEPITNDKRKRDKKMDSKLETLYK
jgi:hypothetical protein